MKDDIVERLRYTQEVGLFSASLSDSHATYGKAADEIERLRREVERLNARTLTRPWGD